MTEKYYWKSKWSGVQRPANAYAKRVYRMIKSKRLKSILDLGCGDGRDSKYFADRGLHVTALDYSKSGVGRLKAERSDIHCILKDIRKMQVKKNGFDVIYAHLSLHYFTDRETTQIFTRLHEFLKPRGLLFVKVKSTDDALYGIGKRVGPDMFKKGHTRHFFSKDYMREKLGKFKIISLRKTSSTYTKYKSSFIEAVATK